MNGLMCIYQLVDLDTWEVLYIGKTWNPALRIDQHATAAGTVAMRQLFETRRVGLEELAWVERTDGHRAECEAIAAALARGCNLVNKLQRPRADRIPGQGSFDHIA